MPYLNRITNLKFGGAVFSGTTDELNTVSGIVPGIANPNGALVVNSLNDLSGINALTANLYNGLINTAAQPNITTVGTLLGLSVTGTTTTDILTATSINGALITAAQPNITSIGNLTGLALTGPITSEFQPLTAPIGMMAKFKSTSANKSTFLDLENQSGTRCLIGCDGDGIFGSTETTHVVFGNYTNGDLKLYTNATVKMRIKSSGLIGINTTTPNKQLSINNSTGSCLRLIYNNVNGTETEYTDYSVDVSGNCYITPSGVISYIKSNVVIGRNNAGPNVIYFNGTSGAGINVTTIAERIYGGGDKSELLLFKGTDNDNTNGPDRIRLRAAEHRIQTYTSIEDFSSLSDNNTRLIIINSGLIGIGTTVPNKQLSINNATGDCLRIIYNDSTGTELIYSDFKIDSNGDLNIIPTGTFIYSTKRYRIQSTSGDGFSHLSPNGLVELITRSSNTFTQIGNVTNTSLHIMINNTNRLTVLTSGNVGIGTTIPNKKLSINDNSGECLRLIFNNSNGTESIYSDITVDGSGNLNLLPSGGFIKTTNKRFEIINNGLGFLHLSGTGVELSTNVSGNLYAELKTTSNHPLYFGTNSVSRMIITNIGRVGVNTLTPSYQFQVNTLTNAYGLVHTDGVFTIGTSIGGPTSDTQIGSISAHSLTFFANAGLVKMTLATSGNFGINTTVPNKKLSINSSTGNCLRLIYNDNTGVETVYSDISLSSIGDISIIPTGVYTRIKSGLVIGKTTTGPNILQFGGLNDDNEFTTVLMERNYADSVKSELLIFKGDDVASPNGPDRIRIRAAEIRFQTSTIQGEKAASGSIGTILDNNNRLIILNSGFIGLNTTTPNKQLSINSSTGNCLRLIFNNSTGGETIYSDYNIANTGKVTLTSVGSDPGFIFSGGEISGTLASGPQLNITSLGTLAQLNVTGTLTAGTFVTTVLGGTLLTAAQPNITSVGNYLLIGTSTDTTRIISALKSSMAFNTSLSIAFGKFNSTLNEAVLSYTHVNDGSAENSLSLGFFNNKSVNIYGSNQVSINTTGKPKQLNINSGNGSFLRLIYNNSIGTETTYMDCNMSPVGAVSFIAVGTTPSFTFTGGNVTATLASGPQPNITSVGTLTSITVTGAVTANSVSASTISGTLLTAAQPNITSLGTLTNLSVAGTLVVGTFSAGAVASVIQTPGQPNITSLGTLTSLNMSGPITGVTDITATSYFGTIKTAVQPFITSLGVLTSLTMSGPISGVTTLTATSLSGLVTTAAQPNITSVGVLTSLKTGTGKVSINTTSISRQVNINSNTGEVMRLIYNNSLATESVYTDITIHSSGMCIFEAFGTTPRFSFLGGNVAATLSTAAQPNITSLGTLTSLTVSGAASFGSLSVPTIGGTITTAAQPNITSLGVLTGLTMSGAISGVTTLSATSLIGTITTVSQPNITSLGILNGLQTSTGTVKLNTTSTTKQLNINNVSGNLLRLIYNNNSGTETTYTDLKINSTGVLTFTAVGTLPSFTFAGGNVAATLSTASQPNITSIGTLTSLNMSGAITGVTSLSATSIGGTLTTAAQPNITSIGSLVGITLTGIINSTFSTTTGKLGFLKNSNAGYGGFLEIQNQVGTRALFGSDGSALANGLSSSVVIGNFSNGDLKLFSNSLERLNIKSTGLIGVNTKVPNKQLSINNPTGDCLRLIYNNTLGTEIAYIDLKTNNIGEYTIAPSGNFIYAKSNLVIGKSNTGPNVIHFQGTTGDTGINNTVLAERIYSGTEQSELLIFKGNDFSTGGPDRIRLRAAEHRFQIFTSTEEYSNNNDNNDRMIIKNSGLIGINTTVPAKQLSINSSIGQNLRLIYNNSLGTETIYVDETLSNVGKVTFNVVGTSPSFAFTGGNVEAIISTASQPLITSVGSLTSLNVIGALTAGSFSTSNLGGTLTTAAQPNITSVGTLSSLNVSGAFSAGSFSVANIAGTLTTPNQTNITTVGTLTNLNVAGNLTAGSFSVGNLSTTNISGTLLTAAQPNITSVGNLTGLYVAGTLSADVFNIGNVSATLDTPQQPNITSTGTLTVLNVAGITTSTNTTVSTSNSIGSVKLAGGLAISNTTDAVSSTNGGTFTSAGGGAFAKSLRVGGTMTAAGISGTILTAAQPNITSFGALTSLVLSGSITGVSIMSAGTVSATNLGGLITTAAQTNITSLGTLTNLAVSGNITGVNTLTATNVAGTLTTAAQPNVTSLGTLVSLAITGSLTAGSFSATSLGGTVTTAAQPNITSVGTLTSLTTSGILSSTLSTASSNSTTGAVTLAGGLSISNSTDATSSTVGGTLTTAGGGAFAKSLYVGQNLTVGGNLTITGTTTTISSTVVEITDNALLLNNGPAGTNYDSGFLVKRYQVNNESGTGDIVSETVDFISNAGSPTSTTITLHAAASAVDGFYINWWLKTVDNNVRQVIAYNGTTKLLTVNNAFTTIPAVASVINLYNRTYSSFTWQESNKRFLASYTSSSTDATSFDINHNADLAFNNGFVLSTDPSTSSSTGALQISGGIGITNTTDVTSSTNGGTFTSAGGGAFAKSLHVGGSIITTNVTGTLLTASQPNITSVGTLTSLVLSGTLSGITTLTATNIGGTLTTAAQPNITSVGTLTSLAVSGSITSLTNITMSGTISGATTITATNLAGTLTTVAQPNITSLGTLTGLVLSGTISGVTTLTATTLAGTLSTASQPNVTSLGTLTSLTLSGAISGVTTLTATTLAGTLSTAAQSNVTSLGTLTGLNTSGSVGINTSVADKALEINSATGACLRLTHNDANGGALNYADLAVSSFGDLTINTSGSTTNFTSSNASTNNLNLIGTQYATLKLRTTTGSNDLVQTILFDIHQNTRGAGIKWQNDTDTTQRFFGLVYDSGNVINSLRYNVGTTIVNQTNTVFELSDSGQVRAGDGTVSLPSLSFLNDTNTGIYSGGTDILNFCTAGVLRFYIDATGNANCNGNDLNAANISASSAIYGKVGTSTTPSFTFTSDGNTGMYSGGADILKFTTGGVDRLTISTSIITSAEPFQGPTGFTTAPTYSFSSDGNTGMYSGGVDILKFVTGATDRMTIDATGNIGIGTTSPENPLHVESGGYHQLKIETTDTGSGATIQFVKPGETSYQVGMQTGRFYFYDGSYRFVINSGGNVGINTSMSNKQLEINSATGDCLRLTYNDNNGGATIYSDFAVSASGILTITPTGTSVTLAANKDLVLSGTGSITGVSSISANNIAGTITSAAQSNITSLGTLTSLKVTGTIGVGTTVADKKVEINSATGDCLRLTYNDANGGALFYSDFIISSSGDLTITPSGGDTTITGNLATTLTTAAQPNITSLGTLTTLSITNTTDPQLILESTASNKYAGLKLNTNGDDWIVGAGGSTHSQASGYFVYHATSGLFRLQIDPSGNLNVVAHNGSTVGLELGGTLVTSTAVQLNYVNVTIGAATASKALVLDGSKNITGITGLTATTLTGTNIGGTLTTAAQTNITSLGTLTSLTLSGTISGVTTLTATSLAGTLTTAAQTNITSLGTLTGVSVTGSANFGNLPSGSRIRFVESGGIMYFQTGSDGTTGSAADFFIGNYFQTAATSARKNMFKADGKVGFGTYVPNKQLEINSATGDCLRLTYNDDSGSAANYTDFAVSSGGDLTITPSGSVTHIGTSVLNVYSSSAVVIGNSTTMDEYSFIAKNDTNFLNGRVGMAFGLTTTAIDTQIPGASILHERTGAQSIGDLIFSTKSVTNCEERMRIMSTGLTGINTTSPDKQLEINSATGNCLRLTYNDANGTAAFYSDFNVSASGDLTIAPSGGDTNITGALDVTGALTVGSFSTTTIGGTLSTAAQPNITSLGTLTSLDVTGALSAGSISVTLLATTITTAAQPNITSLGIMTSLSVTKSTGPQVTLTSTTSSNYSGIELVTSGNDWQIGAWGSTRAVDPNSFFIYDNVANVERLVINSSGNVGIGTKAPTELLHIASIGPVFIRLESDTNNVTEADNAGIIMSQDNGSQSAYIRFVGDAGAVATGSLQDSLVINCTDEFAGTVSSVQLATESIVHLTVSNSGNVGIGTTVPDKQLEINSATGNCLRLTNNDSNGGATNYLDFNVSTSGVCQITPAGASAAVIFEGRTFIDTDGTEAFLVRTNGNTADVFAVDTVNEYINIISHNGTTKGLRLGTTLVTATAVELNLLSGVTATTAELNFVDVTAGAGTASKALVLDGSKNITGITGLTATTLTGTNIGGTITTAAQPNITSLGTLSTLNITNSGGTSLTITSTTNTSSSHIKYNTSGDDWEFGAFGSAAGIPNSMYWYNGANRMILSSSGYLGIGTTAPDKQLEINSATGDCLRLTYNDNNGTASFYSDMSVSAAGDLTITPSGGVTHIGTSVLNVFKATSTSIINSSVLNTYDISIHNKNDTVGSNSGIGFYISSGTFSTGIPGGSILFERNGAGSLGDLIFSTKETTNCEERMRISSNGSVGIGTSAPTQKLHIVQSTSASMIRLDCSTALLGAYMDIFNFENTRLIMGTGGSGTGSATTDVLIAAWTSSGMDIRTDGLTRMYITSGGSVGIGSTAPDKQLEINSASGNCLRLTYNDGNGSATNYTDFAVSSGGDLTINTSGSTTNFTSSQTTNNLYLKATEYATLKLRTESGSGSLMQTILFDVHSDRRGAGIKWQNDSVTTQHFFGRCYDSGGIIDSLRYNVGTTIHDQTNTVFELTDSGQVRAGNGTVSLPSVSFLSDIDTGMYSGGTNIINFSTGGVARASLDAAGEFSAVLLTETSDIRVKENITPIDNQDSYDKIKQLEIVDYNFISDEQKIKHRGVIAQDLLDVIPTAVHIKSGTTIEGIDDLHTVSNKELMGHLLSAFQHLTQKVEKLEEENKTLKEKVEILENK